MKIAGLIAEAPNAVVMLAELVKRSGLGERTVHRALDALVKSGDVAKVQPGVYALTKQGKSNSPPDRFAGGGIILTPTPL